jgi:hypothetical protein
MNSTRGPGPSGRGREHGVNRTLDRVRRLLLEQVINKLVGTVLVVANAAAGAALFAGSPVLVAVVTLAVTAATLALGELVAAWLSRLLQVWRNRVGRVPDARPVPSAVGTMRCARCRELLPSGGDVEGDGEGGGVAVAPHECAASADDVAAA